MTSPIKLSNPYPQDSSKSRSIKVDIPKELNSVERRAFELNKQFSQSISELAAKPCFSVPYDDSTPWDYHKLLIKKGEDYSSYILDQNNRTSKDKQEAVNDVNQRVKRALGELDLIREEENKGLGRKLAEHNQNFGKKVKELERTIAKQIEKMKVELMESIRSEEKDCERRIAERSTKIVDETVPNCSREGAELYRKPRSTNSSPSKLVMSTPEKKLQSNLMMKKLEESREKIRALKVHAYTTTPVKDPQGSVRKRTNSGLSPYIEDAKSSDFDDFAGYEQ